MHNKGLKPGVYSEGLKNREESEGWMEVVVEDEVKEMGWHRTDGMEAS